MTAIKCATILAATLSMLIPSLTRAQEPIDMAKTHYASAVAYYGRGQYKEAVREFKAAYNLSKKPDLLYNIAQCWERLGDLARSISYYRRYLTESPKAADTEKIKLRIESLARRLERTAIMLKGGPPGAVLFVDDKKVGILPMSSPLKVRPGTHKVEVRKKGFVSFRSTVAAAAGRTVVVNVDMANMEDRTGPSARRPFWKRRRVWTWVTLGLGVAALAAGTGLGVAATDSADRAVSRLKSGDLDGYDKHKKAAKLRAGLADGLFALGGAAVITSVILLFLEGRTRKPGERSATLIVPTIAADSIGFSAAGRF
jgi:tetratricopeptide (TPR) repeat protein